jgi:hypothetical protein
VIQPANLGEVNALIDGIVVNRVYTITEALQASLERLRAVGTNDPAPRAVRQFGAIREADASGIFTTDRISTWCRRIATGGLRRPICGRLHGRRSFANNQDGVLRAYAYGCSC